jgi:hypothetical protein
MLTLNSRLLAFYLPVLPQQVCRNFQRGRCKFGDDCRRKHEGPVVEAEVKDSKVRRRKPKPTGGEDASDEICKNYLAGRCRFGDECRRKHEGEPVEAPAADKRERRARPSKPVKKLDEVCNNFAAGKCRLGDKCRRQHIGEGGEQAEAE